MGQYADIKARMAVLKRTAATSRITKQAKDDIFLAFWEVERPKEISEAATRGGYNMPPDESAGSEVDLKKRFMAARRHVQGEDSETSETLNEPSERGKETPFAPELTDNEADGAN